MRNPNIAQNIRAFLVKILRLILYFTAALMADYFKVALSYAINHPALNVSYQTRKYLDVAQMVPWDALVFGFTFGFVAFIFNRDKENSGITRDDYLAFVFICPLIQVIAQYLLAVTAKAISAFYINPFYFFSFLSALFIALIAEKGLLLKLKLFGVVVIGALGGLIHFASPYIAKLSSINISLYWYTVIGTAMAIFALLNEDTIGDNVDRDNLATINKLRKLY